METADIHQPHSTVLTVRFRWNDKDRVRCFRILEGELLASPCPENRSHQNPPGLGTMIERGTKAIGIKPCGSCLRRKEALNRATPGWLARLLTAAARIPASLWKRRGKRPT